MFVSNEAQNQSMNVGLVKNQLGNSKSSKQKKRDFKKGKKTELEILIRHTRFGRKDAGFKRSMEQAKRDWGFSP
jgi:hypothetical protein